MTAPPPGWPGAAPPPGYPGYGFSPGYPPGSPPGYPPYPGYGPPGYGPPGYGPPAYGPPGYPPAPLQPGVIPLRPLTLSDIYNGAVSYIRANPKATLGLTAIVVIATSLVGLITQVGPLTILSRLGADPSSYQLSGRDLLMWGSSGAAGAVVTSLGTIVLVGMLTVVVGRAVFGASITVAQAWAIVRHRFLALIGFAALFATAAAGLVGVVVLFIAAAIATGTTGIALFFGAPLLLALGALAAYLAVMVSFAPTVIVLERLGVFAAIGRSFALVRTAFWRVLGVLLLTALITYLVTTAVALPFNLVGMALDAGSDSLDMLSPTAVFAEIGGTIGRILALPFTAGVVVLLYTDRRVRAEAFDLVLRAGAGSAGPAAADTLWLTRPPGL